MNINRRAVLFGTTALTGTTLLVACGVQTGTLPAQLTNSLTVGQSVDQALIKIMGDLSTAPISLVSPTTAAPITADLQLAATGLAAFLIGGTPPAGASTLDQINDYFMIALNAAAPVLAVTLPAATPIILAIEAVDALLPIFEGAIAPSTTVAAARRSSGRMKVHARAMADGPMTPDQALQVIHDYLASK